MKFTTFNLTLIVGIAISKRITAMDGHVLGDIRLIRVRVFW